MRTRYPFKEPPNKEAPSQTKAIKVGCVLSYDKTLCQVTRIEEIDGDLLAKLSFEVINNEKTGTDGWYKVSFLEKSPFVEVVDNGMFVPNSKTNPENMNDLLMLLKQEHQKADNDPDYQRGLRYAIGIAEKMVQREDLLCYTAQKDDCEMEM